MASHRASFPTNHQTPQYLNPKPQQPTKPKSICNSIIYCQAKSAVFSITSPNQNPCLLPCKQKTQIHKITHQKSFRHHLTTILPWPPLTQNSPSASPTQKPITINPATQSSPLQTQSTHSNPYPIHPTTEIRPQPTYSPHQVSTRAHFNLSNPNPHDVASPLPFRAHAHLSLIDLPAMKRKNERMR